MVRKNNSCHWGKSRIMFNLIFPLRLKNWMPLHHITQWHNTATITCHSERTLSEVWSHEVPKWLETKWMYYKIQKKTWEEVVLTTERNNQPRWVEQIKEISRRRAKAVFYKGALPWTQKKSWKQSISFLIHLVANPERIHK